MTTYQLKHRIYVQKRTDDPVDANGNPVDSWENIHTSAIWAARRGATGRMFYAAAAVQAEDNLVFTVRYSVTTVKITADMRIVEGMSITGGVTSYAHTYTITAPPVDVGDAHQWIELHVKEVT